MTVTRKIAFFKPFIKKIIVFVETVNISKNLKRAAHQKNTDSLKKINVFLFETLKNTIFLVTVTNLLTFFNENL